MADQVIECRCDGLQLAATASITLHLNCLCEWSETCICCRCFCLYFLLFFHILSCRSPCLLYLLISFVYNAPTVAYSLCLFSSRWWCRSYLSWFSVFSVRCGLASDRIMVMPNLVHPFIADGLISLMLKGYLGKAPHDLCPGFHFTFFCLIYLLFFFIYMYIVFIDQFLFVFITQIFFSLVK